MLTAQQRGTQAQGGYRREGDCKACAAMDLSNRLANLAKRTLPVSREFDEVRWGGL